MYHSYLDTPRPSQDVPHKPFISVSHVLETTLTIPGCPTWIPETLCLSVSRVPQLPGHTGTILGCPTYPPTNHVSEYPVYHSYVDLTGTIPGCPTCPPQTMCLSIPCTTVTGTIPGCPHLPPTNHVSEYHVYHGYLDTPGLSQGVQLAPHKPCVRVSRVPQLPGHTRTIPGCPHLPPANHVSENPVRNSYLDTLVLSRDVQTCTPQTVCLSIPRTTVTRGNHFPFPKNGIFRFRFYLIPFHH